MASRCPPFRTDYSREEFARWVGRLAASARRTHPFRHVSNLKDNAVFLFATSRKLRRKARDLDATRERILADFLTLGTMSDEEFADGLAAANSAVLTRIPGWKTPSRRVAEVFAALLSVLAVYLLLLLLGILPAGLSWTWLFGLLRPALPVSAEWTGRAALWIVQPRVLPEFALIVVVLLLGLWRLLDRLKRDMRRGVIGPSALFDEGLSEVSRYRSPLSQLRVFARFVNCGSLLILLVAVPLFLFLGYSVFIGIREVFGARDLGDRWRPIAWGVLAIVLITFWLVPPMTRLISSSPNKSRRRLIEEVGRWRADLRLREEWPDRK